VISDSDCKQCILDVWSLIESVRPGLSRDDPSTWEYWPGVYSAGLISQALSNQSWQNRVNPELYDVFKNIIGRSDLWVSVDNWGLLRPTKNIPTKKMEHEDYRTTVEVDNTIPVVDKPEWESRSRWLHWDLNPFYWTAPDSKGYDYEFQGDFISENNGTKNNGERKLQGLVNVVDAREEDGGFLIVPGFQHHLKEWASQPHLTGYQRSNADSYDFVYVPDNDPLQNQFQKIPMRARSLLIWSSEMPHCNYSNSSNHFRIVQYIKMFPANPGAPGTDSRRKLLIKHVPQQFQEDPFHTKVIGITDY